jgi:hypothetical protein
MERKTARKTAAKATTAAKAKTPAKATPARAKTAPKSSAAKTAAATRRANARDAKATTPKATGPRLTGPTAERIALAATVAKLRTEDRMKWSEIAAATEKSEPTLAKLRKDVRLGVFAKVSPVAKRTPADAF